MHGSSFRRLGHILVIVVVEVLQVVTGQILVIIDGRKILHMLFTEARHRVHLFLIFILLIFVFN